MADKNEMISANRVYESLLNIVRKNKYDFDDDEEIMTVNFDVQSKESTVPFTMTVDVERQLIRLYSPLDVQIDENNRFEACVNICKCSCELDMGSFDYDLYSGSIEFRMTTSFNGSLISDRQMENMISYTCEVVKKYTDRLCS
ncbi:hypothetical protein [Candidatus Pseudoruminococcus sp.]|uniref:hypothetical protein n=1 Tax=Candidatus Pseudoruminococcus sp. TaxID=3101048 RepID=UPI00399B3F83